MIAGVGTVLSKAGGRYRLFLADGTETIASLRGRFKQETGEQVLVGDRVNFQRHENGSVTIESLEPRRSVLQRRTPGRRRGIRNVAANLDLVVVVGAAKRPEWDPFMIDRFVSVAVASDLPPLVVVNKADLIENVEPLSRPYEAAGFEVLHTSAAKDRGVDALRTRLAATTSLLTGSTGVGKSSLLNRLEPGLELRTAPVSRRKGVGRHTTVTAEMYPTSSGGFLVDTPGLRDIGLWGLAREDVERAFPEIRERGVGCRFDDCRHLQEPDCAVKAAVEAGNLSGDRVTSYQRLAAEAAAAARPWA